MTLPKLRRQALALACRPLENPSGFQFTNSNINAMEKKFCWAGFAGFHHSLTASLQGRFATTAQYPLTIVEHLTVVGRHAA